MFFRGDTIPNRAARSPERGTELAKRNKSQLSVQVLKKFRIIFGSVRQHFREVEESCGVTGSQLWILQEVAKTPDIGVSELAERLSIHQSTCSQLVEKLVAHGLVIKERSKEDQRRVGLRLTEAASKILKNAPGPAEGILPEALQGLSESALLALDRSLVEVIGQLSVKDDKLADKPLSDL
ncbi:putative HTH-type transcriptional regulator YusO [mine drainage metagenome]|uniref:Putative HTH-type transcriptional regulator YusO n=1 Tax=mine drainage metagenome TaxID=410659 RepID=A0A1J5S7T4_9ZZZZ